MSRDVIVTDLVRRQARQLKVPGAAREFEALARQAREEKWSFEDYLQEVLTVEVSSRCDSAVRQRLRDARFPETKTLDQLSRNELFDVNEAVLRQRSAMDCRSRRLFTIRDHVHIEHRGS